MQKFAGKTIVVKYGGAAMKDPTLKVRCAGARAPRRAGAPHARTAAAAHGAWQSAAPAARHYGSRPRKARHAQRARTKSTKQGC